MAGLKPLWTTEAGVKKYWDDSHAKDGFYRVVKAQDVTDILDHNKDQANHNNGWNADKTMRRAGSIPLVLIQKWKDEEGWDAFDPENADRLKRKLNDLDFFKLRTAHWRL